MGDFESTGSSADSLNWFYSVDGSNSVPLLTSTINEAGFQQYTLEDGASSSTLNDPMRINGITLNNNFRTFTVAIPESGSELSLLVQGRAANDDEAIAFDNIIIRGSSAAIPEPGAAGLLAVGMLAGFPWWWSQRRRLRQ
ncbi:MAG: hypothetical protein OHK0029_15910 [Armatimonadaceae bacterium]